MARNGFDPISPWFIAAEELGEYIGIRFGRVPPGKTAPEWIFLRHTDTDGIGGFGDILRKRGARLDHLPQIKHPSAPSAFSALQLLPRFLKPRKRVKWGPLDGPKKASDNKNPPVAVAWHVFDESVTTHMKLVCRRVGVTVNSFLVKNLTKAIRPFLDDQSSVVPWMLPVNVRGKVNLNRDTENHTSYVGVKVRSFETVHDVHRNIYAALGNGEHWANWQAYKLTGPLTAGMRKFMFAKELAISEWYLGSFSNLGDWDSDKKITQADCQGGWLFSPPTLRCQLIGAGCVTFQNRLSITIQAHPELTANPEIAKAWIQNWIKEIEIDIASVLAKPISIP
jgi:NRPS condensation-like uncharacterized protein